MIGKPLIWLCSQCPVLSRPLLRAYLAYIGYVPRRAEWLVGALKLALVPSDSVRTIPIGDGIQLEIDLASAMGRDLYYHGGHERDMQTFLRSWLAPGMIFFDVGANIGELALVASTLVGD